MSTKVLRSSDELAEGTRLDSYVIKSVLGRGAFGITYLAEDQLLERPVAIKEYLPAGFAKRDQDSTVNPLTGKHGEFFQYGLNSFLAEAKTVAKFKHDNIVKVLTFFEKNNTAYMVMEYEVGENLKQYLSNTSKLSEVRLLEIFCPINDGLTKVHEHGFIHRDIKPDNIYIREDSSPVLIDFGAARDVFNSDSGELTRILTMGYAPYEQDSPTWAEQGPWTDIYALGATLYYALTTQRVVSAQDRATAFMLKKDDPYQRLEDILGGQFSEHFLKAIDQALAFHPDDRPQTLKAWNDALLGSDRGDDEKTQIMFPVRNDISEQKTVVYEKTKRDTALPRQKSFGSTAHQQSSATVEKQVGTKKTPFFFKFLFSVLVLGVIVFSGFRYYPDLKTIITSSTIVNDSGNGGGSNRIIVSDPPEGGDNSKPNLKPSDIDVALQHMQTAAQHYWKAKTQHELVAQYEESPSISNRTKYIATLNMQINGLERGFEDHFLDYTNEIKKLRHYSKTQVKQAVDSLMSDKYQRDSAHVALGQLMMEHVEDKTINIVAWKGDLQELSQRPDINIFTR